MLTQGYGGSQLAVDATCKQMLKDADATDEVGPIGTAEECSCVSLCKSMPLLEHLIKNAVFLSYAAL